jgi:predicted GNAT family N-acyltransferase
MIHCPSLNNSDDDNDEKLNGEIVSSVRIFRRTLSTGGAAANSSNSGDDGATTIEAGGIGEVCTSPNHQRRGLSKILLKDAINIMSNSGDGGMSCSLLHANPEFRPVYNKIGGYKSVPSRWSLVPIQLNKLITKVTDMDYLYVKAKCINLLSFQQLTFPS